MFDGEPVPLAPKMKGEWKPEKKLRVKR